MATVNLINKLGLSADQAEHLLCAANTLIPVFNLRSNVQFQTFSATGNVKLLNWYNVSQNRVLRPVGNVIGNPGSSAVVSYMGCYLNFTGTMSLPVYSISQNKTVINDLLASAIACIAKQDLQLANVYMKSFFMLRSMYYDRNTEYSQIKTQDKYFKNYLF